mmetsp:Transcript_25088/g.59214  ORF Transcript_25088/g.59214 Transcript_25088/m.59214 type:complete len:118 (-) Transcript_25088:40-393(-)
MRHMFTAAAFRKPRRESKAREASASDEGEWSQAKLSSPNNPLKRSVVSWEGLDNEARENWLFGDQAVMDAARQNTSSNVFCIVLITVAFSDIGMFPALVLWVTYLYSYGMHFSQCER